MIFLPEEKQLGYIRVWLSLSRIFSLSILTYIKINMNARKSVLKNFHSLGQDPGLVVEGGDL